MTCQHVRERLGEYLTEALDPPELAGMARHLGACAACRSELSALRKLERGLEALIVRPLAPRRSRSWVAAAAAAALLVGLGGGWWIRPTGDQARDPLPRSLPERCVRMGQLLAGHERFDVGVPLPRRRELTAEVSTSVALTAQYEAQLAPGTVFAIGDAADLRVARGQLTLGVASSAPPVAVDLTVGTALFAGGTASFTVEPTPDGPIAVIRVQDGRLSYTARSDAGHSVTLTAGDRVTVSTRGVEFEGEMVDPIVRPVGDDRSRAIDELEQRISALVTENGVLRNELGLLQRGRAVSLPDVLRKLEALSAKQKEFLLEPGAVADVVHDLRELGDDGMRATLVYLKSSRVNDRLIAISLLQALDHPGSVQPLLELASFDADELVARCATSALCVLNGPGPQAGLRALLEDPRPSVRNAAIFGLVRRGDDDAIERAGVLLRDGDARERTRLARSLLLLNAPEVFPLVRTIAGGFRRDVRMLEQVIEYYQRLATPEARSELQDLSLDVDLPLATRERALRALSY